MNAATQRRFIAQKSSIQCQVDPRPRCQDCGRVLVERDFKLYWDGQGRELNYVTPRCCESCAEDTHRKSV